jgi:hypothetical protein
MKMTRFERVHFLHASLTPAEVHLYSFKGALCEWDQGSISGKGTPILNEDVSLLGHVTNTRLIIEPGKMNSLSMILGNIGSNFLEQIVYNMHLPGGLFDTIKGGKEAINRLAIQIGYLSFNLADMDHLGVYKGFACWPVMKYHLNGRDPAFIPFSLFTITAYTGAIVGPPAPDEFAELIRDRGVRMIAYNLSGT